MMCSNIISQSGEAIQSVCKQKEEYSSIFKILLKPIPDDGDILRRKRGDSDQSVHALQRRHNMRHKC